MFDIGGLELMLITVVALLVIGPERLPETLRSMGLWFGRLRRSFTTIKAEIEKEIGMDEVHRQLHNEAVMEEMKRIEREVQHAADLSTAAPSANPDLQSTAASPDPLNTATPPASAEASILPPRTKPRSEAELEANHASAATKFRANQEDPR